jgi:3-oxoacyl-ACP reductase-like protein
MANPTIIEKIQTVYNAKRAASGLDAVDFDQYTMSLPETYTGPQTDSDTVVYAVPEASSNNIGRLKMFIKRVNMSDAVGITVTRGSSTRIVQLLPQLSNEFGLELIADDIVDDVLPSANSFTLTASASNRIFKGSTTVILE